MRGIEQIKARVRTNACDGMCVFGTASSNDIHRLIARVERLEAALQYIVDDSSCHGVDCTWGPTCYGVVAHTALAEEDGE